MHILLTRPLEDSQELILKFKSLGHQVSHLPVINIEKKDYENINLNEFKGIIFTSADAIKNLDLQNFDKKIGNLVYVSGELISYDLDLELKKEGYTIKRIITYKVNSNQILSDEFIKELKSSIPEIVFIYSENSARSYLNLLKKYNLLDIWMETNLMCLGEKASSVLNEIKWKKIFLFNPGEEEYLLYKI